MQMESSLRLFRIHAIDGLWGWLSVLGAPPLLIWSFGDETCFRRVRIAREREN